MSGATHALAGILIGLAIAQDSQPLGALAMGLAASIGALVPDIDHPNSIIGRRAGIVGGAIRLGVKHRGFLHSGIAAAIVVVGALALQTNLRTFGIAAACGYASHILLDALTIQGVPLLWPSRRRISLLPLRTGGLIERVLFLFLLVAAAYLMEILHQ